MCDHASPLPEPVGSEHLVHVLDQEALGLRQEEGHKQLQAATVSSWRWRRWSNTSEVSSYAGVQQEDVSS